MKKFLLAGMLATAFASAQETGVQHSTGIQAGLLGVWVHHEMRLTPELALRAEAGIDIGVGIYGDTEIFGLIPSLRLEPRWYYNLEKRTEKNRNTANNAGNFLAFNMTYNPNFAIVSNIDNPDVISIMTFIPKWGIKRNLGKHFNYEAGIGIGYVAYMEEYLGEKGTVGLDLHLRIGYVF